MKWFKRSGQRISKSVVQKAKDSYANAKRTGKMGTLSCSVQLALADAIDKMSLIEFVNWSGQFTYRN